MTSTDKKPLLGIRFLKKSYAAKPILNIDKLDLYAGETVLLSGRNGAGKSTLMKVLAGLENYNEGSLLYKQKPLSTRRFTLQRTVQALRSNVIYLHQQPFLFDVSVRENLAYGLKCRKTPQAEQALIVQQALHWSGLEHLAERNAKTLSGGEMQRIALARAWVLKPELLLLDEPTANMDKESREQTSFLIRRLISQGTGIVICSHETKPDNRLIDRTLHLKDGLLSDCYHSRPEIAVPSQAAVSGQDVAASRSDQRAVSANGQRTQNPVVEIAHRRKSSDIESR
ncbi:MAG: ABC transporter ATP-binding protein [Halopseudomonas sp.]